MPGHTRAFVVSPSSWGIYLNRQDRFERSIVGDGEFATLRDEIIAGLLATKDRNGMKVVEYAMKADDAYFGKQVGIGPDIVFKLAGRSVDTKAYGPIFTEDSKGSHSMNGIVSIVGPGIDPGNLGGARIIDLAPTILEFLGEEVPEMDGKCLIS
jgi:predicted AlkP superfamily phosphohydrolase/phosphomutase